MTVTDVLNQAQHLNQYERKQLVKLLIDTLGSDDVLGGISHASEEDATVVGQRDTSVALRPIGLCAGEFQVPNDFDAPLPDDLLQDFEG